MAKYLRPRRGSYTNAATQNISLKKGELFFEFPNGNIGKEPARLIIGDGASSYSDLEVHGSGSTTNSFQPALIHPAIYHADFKNSNPATASWTFNSGTAAINNIQPRGTNSGTPSLLPKIIGNIKQALVNHADSLTKLNNDLYCHHISGEIDLNNYTETGIYMIDNNATTYTHGPSLYTVSEGVYSTLRVIENDRKINGNLALTQTMIFNSEIFTRQAKWVSTGLSDLELSWGNWITYEDKAWAQTMLVSKSQLNHLNGGVWVAVNSIKVGTFVCTFNSGTVSIPFSTFGLNTRPEAMLLTCQSQDTWMRYDFDGSSSNIRIKVGGSLSGAVRFAFLAVVKGS